MAAAFAGHVVGSDALDLASGEYGRHLHDVALEGVQHLAQQGLGDVLGGEGVVDGMLKVVARRGGAELQGGLVGFDAGLQLLYLLGGAARAEQHEAAGEGVERAGMPHFEFAAAHGPRNEPTHFGNKLEGGHAEGLVENKHLAAEKIHALGL